MVKINSVLSVLGNIWPYVLAVLVFILLIIIHEFGHFIAAKASGVKVNEFAVGFGPKIFSHQGKETKYSLNLIPLGGYCAMEGEDEESDDERAFGRKKAWKRFIIVAAGAVFNLLLGLILSAISLSTSPLLPTTTVAKFADDAVSSNYGLMVNDKIISVDGRKIYSTYDLSYAFTGIEDGRVDMVVLRDGVKTELKDVTFATSEYDGIKYISVDFWLYGNKKTIGNYITATVDSAISYARVVWFSLLDLIGGKYGLNAVSGPVGVTAAIGTAAKQSTANIWPIMALISINLGIFNLLPIPALDGGRLVFILFEMIFRKPVPPKYESIVHAVGMVILLGFMLIVTFKDIIKLITG